MKFPGVIEARDLLRVGDLDHARRIAEEHLKRIGNDTNTGEVWQLRFVRVQLLEAQGYVEDALGYLESLDPPDADDVESSAGLKKWRGYFLGFLGRYQTSHGLLEEAAAMSRDAGLPELLGGVYLSRAFIFYRQKDYVSSAGLFRSALELSETVGGWHLRGHGLWGIGKNLMAQEHHQEAMAWLEESLGVFEEAGAKLAVATVWSELALCHLGLGNDQMAMELLRRAESVDRACGAVHSYQVDLADIGNVYLYRGDHFTAISYYQRALALAREIKDPISIKKWTRNINLAYARIRLAVDQQNPRIA